MCDTFAFNSLQLGVFVMGVTITLAFDKPRFLSCVCVCVFFFLGGFLGTLKQWVVCANRASCCRWIGGVHPFWTEVRVLGSSVGSFYINCY